jgi:hypothetical protein
MRRTRMIKRLYRAMLTIAGVWAALVPCAGAEGQPPAEGAALPAITLPAPKYAAHQTYLGVSGKKAFTVADIAAEVVIIEIMNMY